MGNSNITYISDCTTDLFPDTNNPNSSDSGSSERGPQGVKGDTGPQGPKGDSAELTWDYF